MEFSLEAADKGVGEGKRRWISNARYQMPNQLILSAKAFGRRANVMLSPLR